MLLIVVWFSDEASRLRDMSGPIISRSVSLSEKNVTVAVWHYRKWQAQQE
jgi:hypothetical protein